MKKRNISHFVNGMSDAWAQIISVVLSTTTERDLILAFFNQTDLVWWFSNHLIISINYVIK